MVKNLKEKNNIVKEKYLKENIQMKAKEKNMIIIID